MPRVSHSRSLLQFLLGVGQRSLCLVLVQLGVKLEGQLKRLGALLKLALVALDEPEI